MLLRNTLVKLAENSQLSATAQKYGLQLGAQHVVAGTNVQEAAQSIRSLQTDNIEATMNYLGELVTNEHEATAAKTAILHTIDTIVEQQLRAHLSIKPTQLGLLIDVDTCYDNMRDVIEYAAAHNIFVNVDVEDYNTLHITLDMVEELQKVFDNVGTVVQAYLIEARDITERFLHTRLRFVKGAYSESSDVAYTNKLDIDIQYIELVELHLLHGGFTSIATHDANIIEHFKHFVEANNIPREQFEFQMLYGFRKPLQQQLARDGYTMCTYVPFGQDWYGYYMRRLAERPQNMSLVTKQVFTKKTNTAIAVVAGALVLRRLLKK